MVLRFEYSLFPPKIHCIMNSGTCTPNDNNEPLFFSGDLKFDTGADITCIGANRLNLHCTEEHFTTWIQQNDNIEIIKNGKLKKNGLIAVNTRGIDKEAKDIKAYAYQLDEFTIESADGSISLGSVPIFVTFDKRFQTPLLGRDLLSLFNIDINNDDCIMKLEPCRKSKGSRIVPQYFINNGIYSRKNMVIEEKNVID